MGMAAHVPRRIFAPSLVVTLAALPIACGSSQTPTANPPPPTQNPPAPTETASSSSQGATAPTATATTTSTVVSTSDAAMQWTVTVLNGKCEAQYAATCPEGATCNPPPPSDYACPKDIPLNSYPLTVTKPARSQECTAEYTLRSSGGTCPPGAHCNPPPPRDVKKTVPCPKP